jgi:YbbR domain-containing protein
MRIFPERVQVRASLQKNLVTQRVRVQVRLRGTPATGYEVGAATADPARVLLRGRRAVLRSWRHSRLLSM